MIKFLFTNFISRNLLPIIFKDENLNKFLQELKENFDNFEYKKDYRLYHKSGNYYYSILDYNYVEIIFKNDLILSNFDFPKFYRYIFVYYIRKARGYYAAREAFKNS